MILEYTASQTELYLSAAFYSAIALIIMGIVNLIKKKIAKKKARKIARENFQRFKEMSKSRRLL